MAKLTTLEGLEMDNKYVLYGAIAAAGLLLYMATKKSGLSDDVPTSKISVEDLDYVHIEAKEWRDKVNGNSYWSSRVYFGTKGKDYSMANPFQYGYGIQAEYTSVHELGKHVAFKERDYEKKIYSWENQLQKHLGKKYKYSKEKALKREVVAWGKM